MDERFEDPSESTSCEATLTEGNHFIESLLEVTNGILYIYDLAEHRNVFANEGIQRSLGYSAAEIRELGDSVLPSLMHPDDHRHYIGEIVPRYSQVADRERIVNRYRMKNRSGDWRWIESTEIVYRRDADGAPRLIMGLGIDITERKAAEKELERHRDHLEELVAQRTAQLESANKELDAFCHSVSHDLRAPLRYLDGFAGLLVSSCREDLSDEGCRYVDIVASYAKRMGCLIDDLLEFSRTSRQEMSMQQVNMELVLREALVPVQSASRGRNIEWRIGKLRPVGGDHNLLRQVWANLVENAVKYTAKKDAALIEIGCEPVGTEIVFSVRDNGAGFDPRYADRLFGVFQRLHRSEEFEGTGIGLATVHRILSRHGGRIWAESAVDQGATFRFALPVPIQEAPSPEPS
ncbi:MAG TPA: ATP-binding protein [Fibrobacteria bacterium]|nr:ATP-binding protein [Fibrobacteria bacterium]